MGRPTLSPDAQNSVRRAHLRRALIVVGCAARSSAMVETTVTSAQIRPSAETALVTFIRPSRYALRMSPAIHFLGACEARGKFSLAMRPGHHVFVVRAENSGAIVADLARGKHYFVEVSPTEVHSIALTPRGKKWRDVDGWLQRTATRERVRRGMEHVRGYDAVDLEKRTLHAGDGI